MIQWFVTLQELINVLQLRHIVLPVAAVLDEQWPIFQVFFARVHRIEFVQFAEYSAPGCDLYIGVFDADYGLAESVRVGQIGEILATLAVNGIFESLFDAIARTPNKLQIFISLGCFLFQSKWSNYLNTS